MIGHAVRGVSSGVTGHQGGVTGLVFLEEHVLVSASYDRTVKVWDCTNTTRTTEVLSLVSTDAVTTLCTPSASSSHKSCIVWGTIGGTLSIRDLRSAQGAGDASVGAGIAPAAIKTVQIISDYRLVSGDTLGRVEIRDLRFLKSRPILSLGILSKINPASMDRPKEKIFVHKSTPSVIPESVWDIAMGKTSSVSTRERKKLKKISETSMPVAPVSTVVTNTNAHNSALICLGELRSNVILSVANDRTLKIFCAVTGQELHTATLPDRILSGTFSNSKLLIGTRDRFTLYDCAYNAAVAKPIISNATTHVGGIVCNCFVGDWALCTGGTDKHIFVHKLVY